MSKHTRPAPLETPPTCTTCELTLEASGMHWRCRNHENVAIVRRAFVIPDGRIAELQDRFAKMARRAAKCGVEAPRLTDGGHVDMADEGGSLVRYHHVFVDGIVPRINGWAFLASIHHARDEEDKPVNVLFAPAGAGSVPLVYRDVGPKCDHCGTRRRRSETFVLVNESGEHKQVGRSCLADFLRSGAIEAFASAAEYLKDAFEEAEDYESDFGGHGFARRWRLAHFLTAAAVMIQQHGWCSRKAARESSDFDPKVATAQRALSLLLDDKTSIFGTDDDVARVEAAIEWAREIPEDTSDDYLANLNAIARIGSVESRTSGIAASLLVAHDRELARRAEDARPSVHFGTVGKREVFRLTVIRVIHLETAYGVSHMHIMQDASGNLAFWKSSSASLDTGVELMIKGTVKAHSEYKGKPQTVLSRCSQIE